MARTEILWVLSTDVFESNMNAVSASESVHDWPWELNLDNLASNRDYKFLWVLLSSRRVESKDIKSWYTELIVYKSSLLYKSLMMASWASLERTMSSGIFLRISMGDQIGLTVKRCLSVQPAGILFEFALGSASWKALHRSLNILGFVRNSPLLHFVQ